MARYLISLDATVHSSNSAAEAAIAAAGATVEKTFSFPLTYEIEATAEQLESLTGVLQSIEKSATVAVQLQVLNKDHLDYTVKRGPSETISYNPVTKGAGQHVYLVDTGIRTTHEQFSLATVNNLHSAFASDPLVDDFDDTHGHGTGMASMIVGKDIGTATEATLHNVKLFETSTGQISVGDILDAFDAILTHHNNTSPLQPKVVCLPWTTDQNNFIDSKVIDMNNSNLVVVAAAGNTAENVNTKSPAGVDIIVTVGAYDRDYQVAAFTNGPWGGVTGASSYNNYGAQLDIFALGVNVNVADIAATDAYASVSGTSVSAAIVAGIATHYTARYTNKTSSQLKDIILQEGHLLGIKMLSFDNSSPDVDYAGIYPSIITTDNLDIQLLTTVPSGRIINVQNGTTANVDLGLNLTASNVSVLDFAPVPPFVTADLTTGIISVDASNLDPGANLVPGIYVFAIKGNLGEEIQVEEFSVGIYENNENELELATQYYYDAELGSYDPVVEYAVGASFKN